MWNISKTFDFCYGHRVWCQSLTTSLSLTDKCKCRHLHGHQGTVIVSMKASDLNKQGMVTDFLHLNWFKKFLDDTLDHKFIIDKNDPLFEKMISVNNIENTQLEKVPLKIKSISGKYYSIIDTDKIINNPEHIIEYFESFVIVDFIPTSENLSKWLYEIAFEKMRGTALISSVQLFETPKSQSTYGEN